MAPDVRVVCDSTADLDPEYRRVHEIPVVALKVIFGDEVLADGVDIDPDAFYARMRTTPGSAPRTSQPSPADFEAVFREAAGAGTTIVCTTISSELSGSLASATAARDALPQLDIRLIDSRTAGLGHNAVVRAAVAAAESGADADEVVRVVQEVTSTQQLVFTVETLEYLHRGGRIGGARALLGSLLNIKPVLHVDGGSVEALDRVRTYQRAIDRLVQELETFAGRWGGRAAVTVGHAARAEGATALAERARAFSDGDPVVVAVGPVIGCHAGPGAFGLAFHRPLG
ncbi:MAG: DegV family protein [Candidatus Dormibacteria bacterium]